MSTERPDSGHASVEDLAPGVATSLVATAMPRTEGDSFDQILAAVEGSDCDLLIAPCPYGIDMATHREFIATGQSTEEIARAREGETVIIEDKVFGVASGGIVAAPADAHGDHAEGLGGRGAELVGEASQPAAAVAVTTSTSTPERSPPAGLSAASRKSASPSPPNTPTSSPS